MRIFSRKLLSLLCLWSVLCTPQAFGKWDLSDSKKEEVACLNCCDSANFQEQCDAEAERNYFQSFYAHRVTFAGLIAHMALSAFRENGASRLAGLVAASSFGILNLKQLAKTSWNSFVASNADEPEGIVLIVRAKSDWNFGLSSPYLSDLKTKNLVLTYTADFLTDISDAIRNVRSRFKLPIKALVWPAHGGVGLGPFGSETIVNFGEESVGVSNIYRFNEIFSLLDKHCIIVVWSCLSAYGEDFEVLSQSNIAQALASVAAGRKVYASADLATPFGELDADLLKPRFRSMATLPFSLLEFFSSYTLDLEAKLDLVRCYRSTPDGHVERCSS